MFTKNVHKKCSQEMFTKNVQKNSRKLQKVLENCYFFLKTPYEKMYQK